jgi:4-hydroxybenzoate polyprenyltransferase/phosphoserine phosphatase
MNMMTALGAFDSAQAGPVAGQRRVLVVDLDHTLVRTDLLHESLWRAIALAPTNRFALLRHLPRGRADLKAHLAEAGPVDAATLPYNEAVLERLRAARAEGRMTVLCTASDQRIADAVAAHLGLFDEVHGSDGVRNLKGRAKADFLAARFGEGEFDYVGDSASDLPVWKRAHGAVTVGLAPALRRRVATIGGEIAHIDRAAQGPMPFLKAMRPHQWLKNVLVFLPVAAAHDFALATWLAALAAFFAFNMVASSVYLTNDLLDLEADRNHPRKKNRPFACGDASILNGSLLALVLLAIGFALALMVGRIEFVAVLIGYYLLTTAYSVSLKRNLMIDISTLAGLYTMRIVAGSAATQIPLSQWLIGFSLFFFFSLAAVKRQAELVDGLASGRDKAAGRAYETADLPIVSTMAIAAGYAAVLQFALYLNSDDVLRLYQSPKFMWGVGPILLFWVSRMVMQAHRGLMHDDPIIFAVRDRVSQLCGVGVVALGLAAALL